MRRGGPAPRASGLSLPVGPWFRAGFGMWVIVVIVLVLLLSFSGGISHFMGRDVNRKMVEAYLGRMAVNIATSAIEEAYYRLHHHSLDPDVDPAVRSYWEAWLVSIPSNTRPPEEKIQPVATRYYFQKADSKPHDFSVELIDEVRMNLVDWSWDADAGFWCGALEFDTQVRLRIGAFPAGIAVTRRLRVRKRYMATQMSATQAPNLRYFEEDVTREVVRR